MLPKNQRSRIAIIIRHSFVVTRGIWVHIAPCFTQSAVTEYTYTVYGCRHVYSVQRPTRSITSSRCRHLKGLLSRSRPVSRFATQYSGLWDNFSVWLRVPKTAFSALWFCPATFIWNYGATVVQWTRCKGSLLPASLCIFDAWFLQLGISSKAVFAEWSMTVFISRWAAHRPPRLPPRLPIKTAAQWTDNQSKKPDVFIAWHTMLSIFSTYCSNKLLQIQLWKIGDQWRKRNMAKPMERWRSIHIMKNRWIICPDSINVISANNELVSRYFGLCNFEIYLWSTRAENPVWQNNNIHQFAKDGETYLSTDIVQEEEGLPAISEAMHHKAKKPWQRLKLK